MKEKILKFLKSHKKIIVSLIDLENQFSGKTEYREFALLIQSLVHEEILEPVYGHGMNHKSIPLFHTYRIIRKNLRNSLQDEIQMYNLQMHSKIQLHAYFALEEAEWRRDLPYIQLLDKYLKENGLPEREAFTPERSFQLTGDEKWIDEKGGKKLLERIGLWQVLKISSIADPLMLSINSLRFPQERHRHLVVENKAAYYLLAESLRETTFTSLIYGAGWKIVSNITMAAEQLGLQDKEHRFYYFGDIDLEGISIWYSLYKSYGVDLALPFYKKLLQKSSSMGKETQYRNEKALKIFTCCFSLEEQQKIWDLFDTKRYYPQEGLHKEELQDIWRSFHGDCF